MNCIKVFLAVVAILVLDLRVVHAQSQEQRSRQRADTAQDQADTAQDNVDGDTPNARGARPRLLQQLRGSQDGRAPETLTLDIDGLERQALVYLPKNGNDQPAPVVFGFHGHGGTMRGADRSFGLQSHWPEAIVVYMQGVPTPGRLTDPEGKRNGWQHGLGDQGDRDLKFFDNVLATLRENYKVDDSRIYSTGHSNGGGFTYLLWVARGDRFTAMAPSAAASRPFLQQPPSPLPLMHIAGTNDMLVKYTWQEQMMQRVRTHNGCADEGIPWAKDCTLYPSTKNAPVVTMIHSGTHRYPSEAPSLIVKFFKEHRRGEKSQPEEAGAEVSR